LRERAGWRRIPCLNNYNAVAVVRNTGETGIAARGQTDSGEHESSATTESEPEIRSRELHGRSKP
jgi:hypothetical protein